jgi:hypothetical protein
MIFNVPRLLPIPQFFLKDPMVYRRERSTADQPKKTNTFTCLLTTHNLLIFIMLTSNQKRKIWCRFNPIAELNESFC